MIHGASVGESLVAGGRESHFVCLSTKPGACRSIGKWQKADDVNGKCGNLGGGRGGGVAPVAAVFLFL